MKRKKKPIKKKLLCMTAIPATIVEYVIARLKDFFLSLNGTSFYLMYFTALTSYETIFFCIFSFDSVEPEKGPDYKNELEESVISLQENNKDLYNFAMKQILRKTPKGGKGSANRKTNNKGKKASANKNRYFDTKEKK